MFVIIWRGMGFLVAVFIFGCSLIANLITNGITGSEEYWDAHQWPLGVSFFFSSILCWFFGRLLANKEARILIDKKTGEEITQEPCHALFFIKMHLWGPILMLLGIFLIIYDLVK